MPKFIPSFVPLFSIVPHLQFGLQILTVFVAHNNLLPFPFILMGLHLQIGIFIKGCWCSMGSLDKHLPWVSRFQRSPDEISSLFGRYPQPIRIRNYGPALEFKLETLNDKLLIQTEDTCFVSLLPLTRTLPLKAYTPSDVTVSIV